MNSPRDRSDPSLLQQLGLAIVDGTYPPEERLPDEATMRARYGVSRTALREAYGKLSGKGMIEARPKVGTSVRARAHWNMLDPDVTVWLLQAQPVSEVAWNLHPLRRMLEPGAAALAAQVRTEEELHELEAAFADMRAAGNNVPAWVKADLRFHLGILAATHNPFIVAFCSMLRTVMEKTFTLSRHGADLSSVMPARVLQHSDVLDAIRSQNAELAKMRMEILIDEAIDDVVAAVEADDKASRKESQTG